MYKWSTAWPTGHVPRMFVDSSGIKVLKRKRRELGELGYREVYSSGTQQVLIRGRQIS